jgi:hypothetical protein
VAPPSARGLDILEIVDDLPVVEARVADVKLRSRVGAGWVFTPRDPHLSEAYARDD